MGSTIFVFIGCMALTITSGLIFCIYGIDLIFCTIENHEWKWKSFWLSLMALFYCIVGCLTFPDMVKYQDEVVELKAKLEVYEKNLAKEENKKYYDFEIILDDDSVVELHNSTGGNFLTEGKIEFTLSDGTKLYYRNFKSIKEIPLIRP